ncbi:protein FAM81A-like [Engraulis encrasicolus]|uniref:protein FAM81A-like n=1 Tax=Engraulis encrasicolus TaxID=184585 RepID=UPI002FD1592A
MALITGDGSDDQDQIRTLLEDHIRSVTGLIQRLNKDIQSVQQQMRCQEELSQRAQGSVRTMELQQLAVLCDLRGRVGRCDDSVARLAADFRCTNERIYKLIRQHHGSHTLMEAKLRELETQVRLVCSRASRGDPPDHITALLGQTLDTKLKALSEQLRAQMSAAQERLQREQDSALAEATSKMDKLTQPIKNKTSSDEAVLERFSQLSAKVDRLEREQQQQQQQQGASQLESRWEEMIDRRVEEMIDSRVSKLEQHLWRELQEMKGETNKGFTVVHDSLGSLRQVLEARIKLEKEQLLRELRGEEREAHREDAKGSQG